MIGLRCKSQECIDCVSQPNPMAQRVASVSSSRRTPGTLNFKQIKKKLKKANSTYTQTPSQLGQPKPLMLAECTNKSWTYSIVTRLLQPPKLHAGQCVFLLAPNFALVRHLCDIVPFLKIGANTKVSCTRCYFPLHLISNILKANLNLNQSQFEANWHQFIKLVRHSDKSAPYFIQTVNELNK